MNTGYYYLHSESNDLIYRNWIAFDMIELRESPYVKMFWKFNPKNRATAWTILVEALALGAKEERIKELSKLWECDDEDAVHYLKYLEVVEVEIDGNSWCAHHVNFTNMMECPVGFGDTKLEALAEFCKELGYKAQKMWGNSFENIVKGEHTPDLKAEKNEDSAKDIIHEMKKVRENDED